jgi:hypothetical protein
MNFLQKTRGFTKLDCIRNETIRAEKNILPINEVMEQYCNNWLQHINNARHKITEESISMQTFRKERPRKNKEKMARYIVKTEQAYCLNHGVKKKIIGQMMIQHFLLKMTHITSQSLAHITQDTVCPFFVFIACCFNPRG